MSRKAAARVVAGIAILLLVTLAAWLVLREPARITIATPGDAYSAAEVAALFDPYADDSGVQANVARYEFGVAELTRQLETGRLKWDVVDLKLPDAAEACRLGLIETINHAQLPRGADGSTAEADFVPGALGPCWVASALYSQVIAYDPKRFATLPVRAADFFDLVKFPGGRGMKDAPKGNLELALIADGVPAAGVYEVLATPEGVSRAFLKLESIRAATFWWKAESEPMAILTDGRAAMTTAPNAITGLRKPFAIIWDGQRYELRVFGMVRGTLRKNDALDFIRFATSSVPLARLAERVPHGPARRSSVGEVGEPARTSLPTSHLETAVYIDPNWWAVQGPAIEARWRDWRMR